MKKIFRKITTLLNDYVYIRLRYFYVFNKFPNLINPETFNEKLQWQKLNDRNPQYTIMVDKYRVRNYIKEKIGEEYLIPLLGVWNDPDDIDFDLLPGKFVLKCNHNSGAGMCICKDKNELNINNVVNNLKLGLKEDYYLYGREWPYKNVERKVICEEYLEDSSGDNIRDYKLFCFNGTPKYILVCSERYTNLKETFFDLQWNIAPFKRRGIDIDKNIEKPKNLKKMIKLAEILSDNIPFLRVDFYEVNNKVFFGELTFFPASGFSGFYPTEWDRILGDMMKIDNY